MSASYSCSCDMTDEQAGHDNPANDSVPGVAFLPEGLPNLRNADRRLQIS